MRYGSWKDPNVVRDVKVLGVAGVLVMLAVTVSIGLVWTIAGLLLLGALAAALMAVRSSDARSVSEPATDQPHRGINISRIPLAGFPGFVFAVGFVWMFWSGVPGFRPLVVGIAAVGCLTGFVLIVLERRHRTPPDSPLGLSERTPSGGGDDGTLPPT
jgi:hypothetical protein